MESEHKTSILRTQHEVNYMIDRNQFHVLRSSLVYIHFYFLKVYWINT